MCFTQRPLLDVCVKSPLSLLIVTSSFPLLRKFAAVFFFNHFCSELPTTQCQTPHVKNSINARKETQKSRINVKFDSVHRSSHVGSSKLLKKSTTHICLKDNSRNSKDLLTMLYKPYSHVLPPQVVVVVPAMRTDCRAFGLHQGSLPTRPRF